MLAIWANPAYAGYGPFPAIVDDDTWVAAAVNGCSKVGAEKFLSVLQQNLQRNGHSIPQSAQLTTSVSSDTFRQILADLRRLNGPYDA